MTPLRAQLIRYAPGLVMPEHVDGHRRLSIPLSGSLHEQDRVRDELAGVGSVGLKSARYAHESRFGEAGTTIISLLLPDRAIESLGYGPAQLPDWRWHHDDHASLIALALAAALRLGNSDAVLYRLRSLLATFRSDPSTLPPMLATIKRRLEARPEVAPNVTALADAEGIHPVSLGRLFHRHVGCSITRYRQRVRVGSVARALVATNDSLVDVALDHGFADSSHMTRLFRREAGLSPARFRTLLHPTTHGLESFKTEWALPV